MLVYVRLIYMLAFTVVPEREGAPLLLVRVWFFDSDRIIYILIDIATGVCVLSVFVVLLPLRI